MNKMESFDNLHLRRMFLPTVAGEVMIVKKTFLHYKWLTGYDNESCVCLFAYANWISLKVRMGELPICGGGGKFFGYPAGGNG